MSLFTNKTKFDRTKVFTYLGFSLVNLLFMHYYFVYKSLYVGKMFFFTPIYNFLFIIFDLAIILLFSFCFTFGRLNLSILLTYIITLLWSFANVVYCRFFYQNISLSAIYQAGNVFDGIVWQSILGGFKWIDLFFIISPIIFSIIWTIKSKREEIYKHVNYRKTLLILVPIPFLSFFIAFLIYTAYHFTSSHYRNHPELFFPRVNETLIDPFVWKSGMPVNVHFSSGSIRFIISDIIDEITNYELSTKEKEEIESFYTDYQQRKTFHTQHTIKNVIFILLESFLSSSIDLSVDGKEITPFLNKLKRDSTIYYNSKIHPNITIGESGDGQLIYMTGLLPLRNKITVGVAKNRKLKGLPQILKDKFNTKYTEIVIPSSPVVWEQRHMNQQYGIDNMFSAADVGAVSSFYINEETVFNLAQTTNKESKQPFFSMILGVSTHQPYNQPIDESFQISTNSYPTPYQNYLIACHYVDKQIEKYFNYLHRKGIYDNSLIIITSDHHPHIDQLDMKKKLTTDLPLYIINSGLNIQNMHHGYANQLDVYTTILDILGINNKWLGLGHTLLSTPYSNSVSERTYELSEKIILGDFFKETHQ